MPFELVPPRDRVCYGRGSYAYDWFYILDVDAKATVNISEFVALYDGNPEPAEGEGDAGDFLGYGFPMGFIELSVGVIGLAANMQLYGSFAQDNNYIQADEASYPTWWGEADWNFGGVILEAADPTSVEEISMPSNLIGNDIPLIKAEWDGMEQYWLENQNWVVSPVTEFEYYTYP